MTRALSKSPFSLSKSYKVSINVLFKNWYLLGQVQTAYFTEGREGVKWELGFAFFRGWEMGFCALGLGFMKKKIEKWEWDFNLGNTGWDCGI